MKHALLGACVGIATLSASAAAVAADGTINFRGEVTDATCTVSTTDQNKTVVLPTVSKSHFTAVGNTVANTRFTIQLTGCSAASQARLFFEADASAIDYAANAIKNTATANAGAGVGFALFEESGDRIILGMSSQNTVPKPVVGGNVTLPYEVSYVQYGSSVSPGAVTGSVVYTIDYQ